MKRSDGERDLPRSFRHWLGLQERVFERFAYYFESVGQLAAENSLEPKRWIDDYATLWSGLIGDVGDWLNREAGEPLRPTPEWICRVRNSLPAGQRTAKVGIDVPLEAFGRGYQRLTLVTDGFSRGGLQVALRPGERVRLQPAQVTPRQRRSEVKLFNLPLLQRGIYSGMVCASETDLPVAIVEFEVV